jgi:hypothetical protein
VTWNRYARYFTCERYQEQGFFHRRVASADHRNLFTFGEKAVARCTRTYAEADQGLFGRKAQPTGQSSGGNDDRLRVDNIIANDQFEGRIGQVDRSEVGHSEFRTESCCLLPHILAKLRSLYSVGQPGKFSTSVVMESCPPGS